MAYIDICKKYILYNANHKIYFIRLVKMAKSIVEFYIVSKQCNLVLFTKKLEEVLMLLIKLLINLKFFDPNKCKLINMQDDIFDLIDKLINKDNKLTIQLNACYY